MVQYPAAYYKKGGLYSIFLDGRRVNFSKCVANDKKEATELKKKGWHNSLVECFKPKTKAKPKAEK